MANVLIAGCGDVGSALGVSLLAAGHRVWGLKRDPTALPQGIRPLAADLADPASLGGLPAGLDYVVYTAAAGGYREERYRSAYVDGVRHLLGALRRGGQRPRRLLFTSSTSVYAQSDGQWVDEDTPAAADNFAGRCLRAGEGLFWSSPWPATVLRLGGIYGPGRTRLLDTLRAGAATCVEDPPLYTNRIHRDDCARALHHLLNLERPEPLYLGVDDDPAPQCQVLGWLAAELGVPPPTVVPAPALPRSSKRCRNDRLKATGFRLRYPSFREGYRTLLQLY